MIYLVLDTSSTNLLVSIVRDKEILIFKKLQNIVGHSTILLKEIEDALKEASTSTSSIDTIFIVNGPGSFTGLRVGVTVAKMLAYTLKKKIVPISSLEVMASSTYEGDYVVPYIDARRGFVFAGIYDQDLHPILKDAYISVENLLKEIPAGTKAVYMGYTDVSGIESRLVPQENIIKIIEKHKNDAGWNPHAVNPNYLKRTEAEEKKDANQTSNAE